MDFKDERLNRGRSVPEFASDIGVKPWVLRNVEAGGTPSPANAFLIAKFYGFKVTDLWPVDGSPVEHPEPKAAA